MSTNDALNQSAAKVLEARSWPFLRTPISIFLIVMLPINGLMVFLLIANTPTWMKVTSGILVLWSMLALAQGYLRRLIVDRQGIRLRGLFRSIEIPWSAVKNLDVYIPGGGLGATEYLYVTTKLDPPLGKWDVDDETIQVQDRPGLLDAVRAFQKAQLSSTGQF